MAGIFGLISSSELTNHLISPLIMQSQQRGNGACGYVRYHEAGYEVVRSNNRASVLLHDKEFMKSKVVFGFSDLKAEESLSTSIAASDDVFVICDSLILNKEMNRELTDQDDADIDDAGYILKLSTHFFKTGGRIEDLAPHVLERCEGIVSTIIGCVRHGKALLMSNNGSLYTATKNDDILISSEMYPLKKLACADVFQCWEQFRVYDIPKCANRIKMAATFDYTQKVIGLFKGLLEEESLLKYENPILRRCTKCVLPETMPYISFDDDGVCNYCRKQKPMIVQKPKEELLQLLERYRRKGNVDCIVPFSGGRDSSYGLHIIVKELGIRPITFTYNWGMVTDLGARNVSKMCAELGVENIMITADIRRKRNNIRKNLNAWLKAPNLGMISILTAGDKHFFRYLEKVKEQTGISLNLWGVNPMEATHFKSGFLGVKPAFEQDGVYRRGLRGQIEYQHKRFKAMLKSPGYFNTSLWDTLSGEYYRSIMKKTDYYHIFDYWMWNEDIVESSLEQYGWEKAPDTNATWRIGDGTAAFYNYVYYTVAGFSEHDTFRSNQIREGHLTREEAMEMVIEENKPRYQYIRWYLDALGMDFTSVINVVNSIPKIYNI